MRRTIELPSHTRIRGELVRVLKNGQLLIRENRQHFIGDPIRR